jgi:hypothetical protein
MISFPCEKCGASLCAPDECTGSDSRCRQCGNLVVVPGNGSLVGRPPDQAAPPWLPLATKAPGHATTGSAMPTGRAPRSWIVLGSAAVVVLFICVVSVLGLGIWVMTNLEGATKEDGAKTLAAGPGIVPGTDLMRAVGQTRICCSPKRNPCQPTPKTRSLRLRRLAQRQRRPRRPRMQVITC